MKKNFRRMNECHKNYSIFQVLQFQTQSEFDDRKNAFDYVIVQLPIITCSFAVNHCTAPMEVNDETVAVTDVLPPKYTHVFPFARFNRVQSAVVRQVLDSDRNLVVAAPTGSGKTAFHELAIIRLLINGGNTAKTVFIAPNKALCQQRKLEWERTFGTMGLQVLEVTGDSENSLQMVAQAQIILTTPEKWDALTRTWRRHLFLFGNIRLILVDEVHHLGEDRGATLETVVVRMRILSEVHAARLSQMEDKPTTPAKDRVRIVALSATLPNLGDIGEWLQCDAQHCHFFDDGFRPVPLTMHTLSYGSASNLFLFERSLDERVPDVVKTYSDNKQTLVFCSSKKGTETLAKLLMFRLGTKRPPPGHKPTTPFQPKNNMVIQDAALRDMVARGYAYHHAGLPPDDRAAVEESFLSGRIQVILSYRCVSDGSI